MGETDISLVPLNCFNSVVIDHSGFPQTMVVHICGVVELLTIPEKQNIFIHRYTIHKVILGLENMPACFQLARNDFNQKHRQYYNMQNNFPYYDYIRKSQTTRTNSEYRGLSINQSLFAQGIRTYTHVPAYGIHHGILIYPQLWVLPPTSPKIKKIQALNHLFLPKLCTTKPISPSKPHTSRCSMVRKIDFKSNYIKPSSIESTRWLNN